MKKWLSLLFALLPIGAFAQVGGQQSATLSNPFGGNITASSTNCSVAQSCIWQKLPATATTTTITITGTFNETLIVETSGDGGNTFSTSSTQTAPIVLTVTTTSLTDIRVRSSVYTSGSAGVNIQTAGNQLNVTIGSSSGGGGAANMGPVINVTNPALGAACPASTNADWNACFTLASAAAEALSLVGTPTYRIANLAPGGSSVTSLPITLALQAGDTSVVWVVGMGGADTVTVTDDGNNAYSILQNKIAGVSTDVMMFATAPRAAAAATTITIHDGTSRNLSGMAAAFTNVGAIRMTSTPNSLGGSTTAPSINDAATIDTNNLWVSGFTWFSGGTVTAAQNGGTLQLNTQATSGLNGMALVTQSGASYGASLTNSLTLSGSSNTVNTGIELRSHSEVTPTIYIPQGWYNYSGGLSLLHSGVIMGQPGSDLCYIGTNHAVDIAPTNLVSGAEYRNYYIDGLTFTCGLAASEGIYINPFAEFVSIRTSNFINFTQAPAWQIFGTSENWDLEIGPQNKFVSEDWLVRNIETVNTGHVDNNSYVRVHDNVVACWKGTGELGGCSAPNAGVGFVIDGAQSRIYHNNLAFMNPDIQVNCTAGPCFGNEIAYNQMEPAQGGVGQLPAIQYDNTSLAFQIALVIHENVINMGPNASSPIGPASANSALQGARINFNTGINIGAAVPFVAMNNLVGQTGNQSSNNLTSASTANLAPVPIPHTTGSNITAWGGNTDDTLIASGTAPTITGTGTCATVSTGSGTWTGQITCTTAGTAASTIVITPGSTAPHNWVCNGSDATQGTSLAQSGISTTTCTLKSAAVTANDVLTFTFGAQ